MSNKFERLTCALIQIVQIYVIFTHLKVVVKKIIYISALGINMRSEYIHLQLQK